MNFRYWPDEFQPTVLRRSKREVFIFFLIFLFFPSHSTSNIFSNTKNGRSLVQNIFVPFYTSNTWLTSCHLSPIVSIHFCLEIIYFIPVQVQIILYELSLNYYPTSKIFFRNLVFGAHRTPITPKNFKIPTISEFN